MEPVPDILCEHTPSVVRAFVARTHRIDPALLSAEDRQLLLGILACRYSCEVYIEARAAMMNKRVIYVRARRALDAVPSESQEVDFLANPDPSSRSGKALCRAFARVLSGSRFNRFLHGLVLRSTRAASPDSHKKRKLCHAFCSDLRSLNTEVNNHAQPVN